MTGREKLCLQMRNKNGQDKETYCRHYLKGKGVYMRGVFFGFKQTCMFIICVIFTLISVLKAFPDDDILFKIIPYVFAGVSGISYLGMIFKGLWYWKYTKHVFVTDEGIWIMICSTLWWAPDFAGKRRFLSPAWSLYEWRELKSVTQTDECTVRRISKILYFFEEFDNFVSKSPNHTTLFLKRWDGVERIDFLKNTDAEEILAYYKTQKKSRKTQKQEEITEE